jgi:ribonucleoside-diphosphate reductase alpha chain
MNLTELVVRSTDTYADLIEKTRLATVLGTFQSTLTHFPYLRKIWQKNTEEERLLGVSMTGIMDHPATSGKFTQDEYIKFTDGRCESLSDMLEELRLEAQYVNKDVAEVLGINMSTAITCVKPSGTVSQLVNSASGIHARHSEYYVRTVRADVKDPLTTFLKDMGVPNEPDVMKPEETVVFSFPIKSPETAVFRTDMTAIEQLELWKVYQEAWCEHKPSITVSVKNNEWPEVGGWVFNNFDLISGVSFLPFSDHVYQQAPYQDCTKEEYEALLKKMPKEINWNELSFYEKEDTTSGMQTLACSSDGCEVVDIGQ